MDRIRRRGYDPEDWRWFSGSETGRLQRAQQEMRFLLDRGYQREPVMAFIGNHYQFSQRQRNALQRATSSTRQRADRASKRLPLGALKEGPVEIDGFNLLITLEAALSGSPVLACDDGVFRDLAGLRGSYSLIGHTGTALCLLFRFLKRCGTPGMTFFLDAPVSNSGRLRQRILEEAESWAMKVQVHLVPDADRVLSGHGRIVTSDSILLDRCGSWFNLAAPLLIAEVESPWIVALDGP